MRRLLLIIVGLIASIVSGCSSDKGPPPYKAGGIVVSYSADENLNSYDRSPHTVMLAVYQLNSINGFHQLSKDIVGTQKLLDVSKFDSSVLGFDTLFINANESGTIKLDRLQNVEWIGVVAGYYDLTAGQVTKEFQIPTDARKALNIKLILSPDSLQEVPSK